MFILIDNLKINYEKEGSEKTDKNFVLLHGWQDNLKRWDFVSSFFVDNHQIVRLDFPGFGFSDTPKEPWDVLDYTEFLNNLLTKLGINDNIILLGHSFGGRVAIKFASLHSEKISKLILVDSAGIKPRMNFKRAFYFILAKIGGTIFSLPIFRKFREKSRAKFYRQIAAEDYYTISSSPFLKKSFLRIINEDLQEDAKKIKNKTLIVWGEKDGETPLKDAFVFNKLIKNSELRVIKNAGHYSFLDKKEEFLNALTNFI